MKSMTGFGKGTAAAETAGTFVVEIASVNRKQLEVRLSLPRELPELEIAARRAVAAHIGRGSVSVKVQYTPPVSGTGAGIRVRTDVLLKLLQSCEETRAKCAFEVRPPSIAELLALPGVLENSLPDGADGAIAELFDHAMDCALEAFDGMRSREGEHLEHDLRNRLALLRELLGRIRPMAEAIPALLRRRLTDKLAAENLGADPSDERVLREILFYADKSDVTEEMTRLESHFSQFEKYLADEHAAGRSLDFLLQEMFREITTLSNKAGTCEIAPLAVSFKTELEKIREQVQNIE